MPELARVNDIKDFERISQKIFSFPRIKQGD